MGPKAKVLPSSVNADRDRTALPYVGKPTECTFDPARQPGWAPGLSTRVDRRARGLSADGVVAKNRSQPP